jgi:nucleoside-diphosphate-sugar epimerase
MKHAFITGAAGFIGGYAVKEFVGQGWHVFALVHRRTSRDLEILAGQGSTTLVRGDIADFASLETGLECEIRKRGATLDAIVHCAGRASDVGRQREFRRANFESVQHLVQLTNKLDVARFVFVSTTDVYGLRDFHGESEDQLPLRAHPRNPYPVFKIAAEEWIRKNLHPERSAIIRPAAVWGVGDPTLTPRIVGFLRRSPWIIHFGKWRGRNRWPLAHVRNVATALFLAATSPEATGQAINVLDSETTSIDEFYRIIAAIFLPEKKLCSVTLPLWAGKVFGTLVSGISNLLNLNRPFADPSLYALYSVSSNLDFSNRKFQRLLAQAGRHIITRDEGIHEIRKHIS